MVELTAIQLLGLVCLLTFSFFVIIILFLECIGRFHCVIRSLNPKTQQQNLLNIEIGTDQVNGETQYNTQTPMNKNCIIRPLVISSGMGVNCFNTMNCYCCWREKELDTNLVIALPDSRRKLDFRNLVIRAEEKSCAICLDDLTKRQLTRLECGHDFHSKCVLEWLQRSDRCPLCKNSVNVDVVSDPLSLDTVCHQSFVFHDLALLDGVSHV